MVEGPRDALHLAEYGIPALAILGGSSVWDNAKAELLMQLEPSLVVLAFDPDKVGREGTRVRSHLDTCHSRDLIQSSAAAIAMPAA